MSSFNEPSSLFPQFSGSMALCLDNRNTCTFNTRGLNSPSLGCIQVNLEYSQPAFQRNAIPFANVKKKNPYPIYFCSWFIGLAL